MEGGRRRVRQCSHSGMGYFSTLALSRGLPDLPLRNLKRLARRFQLVHATPPGAHPVDRTNQPRMTRPLRSTPITGASPLLRAGPPARLASALRPLRFLRSDHSLLPPGEPGGGIKARLLTFRASAADQAHVASVPDTAWPVHGTPARLIPEQPQTSGSDVTYLLTTRQQRFTCVRLPSPYLTALPPPFPHRSPRRSLTNAACGGLAPSPAGRHRRCQHSFITRTAPHQETPPTQSLPQRS